MRRMGHPGATVTSWLLFGYRDRSLGGFPFHVHSAAVWRFVEGDGEILDGSGEGSNLHVDASEVVGRAGIRRSPFASFLADDEGPLVLLGNREEGVSACGNGSAANRDVGSGGQRGGFIGPSAPNLAIWNEFAKNFAALSARARVIDGDGLAAAEVEGGLCGWTGSLGFILTRMRCENEDSQGKTENRDSRDHFTHSVLLEWQWARTGASVPASLRAYR